MVLEINNENINDVLNEKLTVLQFSANWCGPCKALTPRVVEIAEANSDITIGKVDVESNGELANRFKVKSIPVMVYFKDGVEVNRVIGATSVTELQSQVDNLKN